MRADAHTTLIRALQNPALYDHPVERFELIETHISSVLLTGPYAYKIKKPLDLGFLDFSTLAKRRHFCQEELRLNRRLAPQIYMEVLTLTGTPDDPRFNGDGKAIEYVIKMRQFSQAAQLDRVLAAGGLQPKHLDGLARTLASFHAGIAVAKPDSPFGSPESVYFPMGQNFDQIRPRVSTALHPQLERLQRWSEKARDRLATTLAARRRNGFIRECHGDVHLANLALLDDEVVIFDCLEFNENLRWIDVMNEVAFTVMDLDDRGQPALAQRFLNAYLEYTGDYAGLVLLRFYQVYRALVRAKVSVIRLGQDGVSAEERARIEHVYRGYADLAERYTHRNAPALIVAHGLSGSGKSTYTQPLVEALGAIRVRSDVERKRLHGLAPESRSGSALNAGLYTAAAGQQTYDHLAGLARTILDAGYTTILDATFLKHAQREQMRALARERNIPFLLLSFEASESVLRERVRVRERAGHDASEAGLEVLTHQQSGAEPLIADERGATLTVNTDHLPSPAAVCEQVRARLAKAGDTA